jgi:hypothetical protein
LQSAYGQEIHSALSPEVIAHIQAKNLDMILRFGSNILHGKGLMFGLLLV